MRYVLTIFLFIMITAAAGCSDEVARVGAASIRARDLARRVKIMDIYYPGSGENAAALSQLISGMLAVQILNELGDPVDDAALEKEARRIDETSKAPDTLAVIKQAFKSDRAAYLRTYVAFVYAERVLYSNVFLHRPDIQTGARDRAESLVRGAAANPASFSSMAAKLLLPVAELHVSRKYGIFSPANHLTGIPAPHTSDLEHAERLHELLAHIPPGAVCRQIIEWPEEFQVVRLLGRAGKDLRVQSVAIPKRSFDDWFWERASQVPVRIRNHALKAELLKEISWASRLKLD